jgi:DNA repair protein RadC
VKYDCVSERCGPSATIKTPRDLLPSLKRYTTKRQEHFLVATLDGAHAVIRLRIVSIGLANRTLVHPREVFQVAIQDNATSVIVAHNHPSGQVAPSDDDREVTKRLKSAGEILGIPVLDHIVFGRSGFFSFAEAGQF